MQGYRTNTVLTRNYGTVTLAVGGSCKGGRAGTVLKIPRMWTWTGRRRRGAIPGSRDITDKRPLPSASLLGKIHKRRVYLFSSPFLRPLIRGSHRTEKLSPDANLSPRSSLNATTRHRDHYPNLSMPTV